MLTAFGWGLDLDHRLLLRAALAEGAPAALAYRAWRRRVPLDDIGVSAYRLLPGLVRTALRHGVDDADLPRIKGVVRHTWLANQLRSRTLAEALDALRDAGIEAMVMKGAALFARDPQLAAVRGSGDYDILVRRRDAPAAIRALIARQFHQQYIRVDRFAPADFDLIHAVHLVKSGHDDSLDLHWRPLPVSVGEAFIDDLFARSDTANFGGREIRIPALADHLFLALARPAAWDQEEIVLRAAEAGFLLRGCEASLDWERFVSLTRRIGDPVQTRAILGLVRAAGGTAAPVPVLSALAEGATLQTLGARIAGALPPSIHSFGRRAAAGAVAALRPRLRTMRITWRRPTIAAVDRTLETLWRTAAARTPVTDITGPAYLSGFSFPENEGRWTNGPIAVLAIPITAAVTGPVAVRLTVLPFCAPGEKTFVFDACVGPGTCRRHVIRFDQGVPASPIIADAVVLEPPARIVLVLRLLDAGAPLHFGLSDDPRALGLMLQRLEILAQSAVVEAIALGAPQIDERQDDVVDRPSRNAANASGIASGTVPVSTK